MTKRDYVQIAHQYCLDVIYDRILTCEWVKKAVKRQLDDLENLRGFHFDETAANRVCKFIECLTHVKGNLAGQRIHLEPWQVFILTTVFGWKTQDGRRRFRRVYIEVPRGNGKALSLDTLIPTPKGFVTMADLQVGDYVYSSDGKPCRITAATEVMYERPCYELEFNTGDVIIADAEHQWVTDARRDRDRLKGRGGKHKGPKPSVKTTEEIASTLMCRKDHNHRIKISPPVEGSVQEFELEPYMLGLWLGDGNSGNSGFTCNDDETIERIRSLGYSVKNAATKTSLYAWRITDGSKGKYANQNSFYKKLQRLGVLGNKHIPEAYMTASEEQRLELLQGLMDTDGFISKGQGQCEFVQKNKVLARQVYRLIASLGFRPRILEKSVSCRGKPCGIVYRILFHAYRERPVFKLTRKLERMRERPALRGLQDYRQIVRCEPVPSVPVRCIEVDSDDHCYLAGEGHIITHNSCLSSGIALFCLCADKEPGAEIYSFATTRDQAKIVFGDAKRMAEMNKDLRSAFGLEVLANALYLPSAGSTFQPKSAEGSTLDGLNTHLAVIDELHAHKTRAVYDVVETSLGKRLNSLMWVITTAGFDKTGICYEVRSMVTKVLSGAVSDETQFGIIYSIDKDDDWTTEEALEKANPNWNISVRPEVVGSLQRKAMAMSSAANNFLTKHLNVWVNADSAWMDMRRWDECADHSLSLDEFEGQPCFIGLDLASKIDICAKVLVFPRQEDDGKTHYYVFPQFWLPRRAVENAKNSQYSGWERSELLNVSEGEVTDFRAVKESILEDCSRFDVQEVDFDPWQAAQLSKELEDEGVVMVEVRQTVLNMSDPMKSLQAAVYDKTLHHDGGPVLTWMMSNVIAHTDAKDNIYPRKEFPENKIDGVVALIMAINRAQSGQREATDTNLFLSL